MTKADRVGPDLGKSCGLADPEGPRGPGTPLRGSSPHSSPSGSAPCLRHPAPFSAPTVGRGSSARAWAPMPGARGGFHAKPEPCSAAPKHQLLAWKARGLSRQQSSPAHPREGDKSAGQTVLSPPMASPRKARRKRRRRPGWLTGTTVSTRFAQQWPREVTSWPALRDRRQERTCAGVLSQGLAQTSWSGTHSRKGRSGQWSGAHIKGKRYSPLAQVRHAEV